MMVDIIMNICVGKRLGGYMCNAWCTSLAYDGEAKYAFVGN